MAKKCRRVSLLRSAIWDKDFKTAKRLLSKSVNLENKNGDKHTLLEDAMFTGNLKMVKLLVTSGASVNSVMKWMLALEKDGQEEMFWYLNGVYRTGKAKSKEERKKERYAKRQQCPIKKNNLIIVKQWLKKDFPNFPFKVERIMIKPAKEPLKTDQFRYKAFKNCFIKGQSNHHCFLKWFAWSKFFNGIQHQKYLKKELFIEAEILIPPTVGRLGSPRGKVVDLLTYNLDSYHGKLIIADVLAGWNLTSVECGVTTTDNLILPIMAKAIKRAIWIPFPYKDHDSEWSDFERLIPACKISRTTKVVKKK